MTIPILSTFIFLSPEVILGFAGKLFNKKQEAYLLKIPVIDFKFGTELHPETKSKNATKQLTF